MTTALIGALPLFAFAAFAGITINDLLDEIKEKEKRHS